MKPEIFIAAQRCDPGEVVDRADIDGAGGSHNEKGPQSVGAIAQNPRAQRRRIDPVRLIDRDAAQRVAAEPRDIHRLGDTAMRGLRRVGGQTRARFANAALPHVRSEHGPARHQNRHQIGHRGPSDKDAAGAGRKAEHLARPLDDLALDLDRHMVAPAAIGIQPGRQHLPEHADCRAAAMHPAHEAGMKIAGRVGRDEIAEFAVDVFQFGRLKRQALAKPCANRVRDRLPERTLANRRDVIEHVVEHAVPERADVVPILRVQRLVRLRSQRRLVRQRGRVQSRGHAARSRICATRRSSIAANASKIFRICGGL